MVLFFFVFFLKQFLVKLLSFILLGAFDINPAANNIGIFFIRLSKSNCLLLRCCFFISLSLPSSNVSTQLFTGNLVFQLPHKQLYLLDDLHFLLIVKKKIPAVLNSRVSFHAVQTSDDSLPPPPREATPRLHRR